MHGCRNAGEPFNYDEFSRQIEQQLDCLYQQTALSEQIIQRFCEELSMRASEALNARMTDWADQNRTFIDAECNHALDRFSARLQGLSLAHVENHRKEMLSLSSNLKDRLRSVAHALQDIGPASHRG